MTPVWFTATLRARLLTALLVLITGSCNNKCTGERDEPVLTPTVGGVEIIPVSVLASPDAEFTLRVRLRDGDGHFLPDSRASEVRWDLDPRYLHQVARAGPDIVVKASLSTDAEVPSFPIETLVKASTNSAGGSALVTLVAPGGAAGIDLAWAEHDSRAAPVIALVDGMASSRRNDSMIAFTNTAHLGDFQSHCQGTPPNCGEVALFSSQRQLGYVELSWTNNPELVNFSGLTLAQLIAEGVPPVTLAASEALGSPIGIPVTVWIAAQGDAVAPTARADLDYAFRVFRDSRTGLTFDTIIKTANHTSVELDVVAPLGKCWPIVRETLEDEAGIAPSSFGPSRVTVVYVDEILEPAASGDSRSPSFYDAYTCPWDPVNGSIVLIAWNGRAHSDLAHELGHAVSPWWPPLFAESGHTNRLSSFDASNLMWPWESDQVPVSRSHLFLGQAFQLSVDTAALVNRPGGGRAGKTTKGCQAEDWKNTPCPNLAHDLVAPPR